MKISTAFLSVFLLLMSYGVNAQELQFEWMKFAVHIPEFVEGEGMINANSISYDNDGNVYYAGYFSGTADFDPGAEEYFLSSGGTSYRPFVSKLDAAGNFVWAKIMPAASSIIADLDGNLFLTGKFSGEISFGTDESFNLNSSVHNTFIAKLDDAGEPVWSNQISGDANMPMAMVHDGNGNIYLCGSFDGTITLESDNETFELSSPTANEDAYLCKFDTDGNASFANYITGNDDQRAADIAVDASGNVYTTGYFQGNSNFNPEGDGFVLTNNSFIGEVSAFVAKHDAEGNFVWAKTFNSWTRGDLLAVDGAGNVYAYGNYSGTIDADPGEEVYDLSGMSFYLTKLDTDGEFVWSNNVSDANANIVSMVCDPSGDLYTTGYFTQTSSFHQDSEDDYLVSEGDGDVYIAKHSPDGDLIWIESMGGVDGDVPGSVSVSEDGSVYVTGNTNSAIVYSSFTADDINTGVTDPLILNAFVLKLSSGAVSVADNPSDLEFQIYPNPGNGNVWIAIPSDVKGVDVRVYDAMGKVVNHQRFSQTERINIDIKGAAGFYLIELRTDDGRRGMMKFVKS